MNTISPWTIYWVLQLDSIRAALSFACFVIACAALFGFLYCVDERKRLVVPTLLSVLAAIVFTAAAFLPSTKTAAAMVVVPAIANNPRIQSEAGDLYQLAKEALEQAVHPDATKAKPHD